MNPSPCFISASINHVLYPTSPTRLKIFLWDSDGKERNGGCVIFSSPSFSFFSFFIYSLSFFIYSLSFLFVFFCVCSVFAPCIFGVFSVFFSCLFCVCSVFGTFPLKPVFSRLRGVLFS